MSSSSCLCVIYERDQLHYHKFRFSHISIDVDSTNNGDIMVYVIRDEGHITQHKLEELECAVRSQLIKEIDIQVFIDSVRFFTHECVRAMLNERSVSERQEEFVKRECQTIGLASDTRLWKWRYKELKHWKGTMSGMAWDEYVLHNAAFEALLTFVEKKSIMGCSFKCHAEDHDHTLLWKTVSKHRNQYKMGFTIDGADRLATFTQAALVYHENTLTRAMNLEERRYFIIKLVNELRPYLREHMPQLEGDADDMLSLINDSRAYSSVSALNQYIRESARLINLLRVAAWLHNGTAASDLAALDVSASSK